MCTGAETMLMGGMAVQGISSLSYGKSQKVLADADARYVEDGASQQAEKLLRAARREKGEARAATAASGAVVDEFSLGIEQEIDTQANSDAAMTVLSGKRKAESLRYGGRMSEIAGRQKLAGSLFSAGMTGYSGWKGAKGVDPVDDLLHSNRRMVD